MQRQNTVFQGLLKPVPWAVVDRLVERYGAERDPRGLKTKAHLVALLYAQFGGLRSLREIETSLRSHAGKLYHLGSCAVSKSALATANASRPFGVFADLLSALMAQLQRGYRRKIGDCVRLIDSTSVRLSGNTVTNTEYGDARLFPFLLGIRNTVTRASFPFCSTPDYGKRTPCSTSMKLRQRARSWSGRQPYGSSGNSAATMRSVLK